MTIQYKNQGFELNTTNLTTVLTIDNASRAIVKGFNITNEHNNNVLVEAWLSDSSESSDYEFFHKNVAADTTEFNIAGQSLILEEGDSIKVQCETANTINGVISYALINRSQENG